MTIRIFAALCIVSVLLGGYAWMVRDRILDCRVQAVGSGASIEHAVKICRY